MITSVLDSKYKQFYKFYNLVYSVLIPLFFALHSLTWILYIKFNVETNFGNLVLYSWKLLTFFLFLIALRIENFKIGNTRFQKIIFFIIFLLVFFGFFNPFLLEEQINYFYFFSDAFGLISILYLFWFLRRSLILGFLSLEEIINPIIKSTKRLSIVILFYALLSIGEKVSIPPEMHFGLALIIGLFFSKNKIFKINSVTLILLLFASIFSFMRIYIIIFSICIFISLVNVLFSSSFDFKRKVKILSFTFLIIFGSFFVVGDIIIERIESMVLVENNFNSFESENEFFQDNSIETRFLESRFIQKSIEEKSLYFLFFGRGFGAEFNYINGPKHHSHIAYISILYRNGILGAILFCFGIFFSFKIFSLNVFSRIFGLSIFITYLAMFTDQYVYYGLHFAVCLALVTINFNRLSFKYE